MWKQEYASDRETSGDFTPSWLTFAYTNFFQGDFKPQGRKKAFIFHAQAQRSLTGCCFAQGGAYAKTRHFEPLQYVLSTYY